VKKSDEFQCGIWGWGIGIWRGSGCSGAGYSTLDAILITMKQRG